MRTTGLKETLSWIPSFNFVQVDLKVGHLDVELKVLFHWIDMIEDVVDNPAKYEDETKVIATI